MESLKCPKCNGDTVVKKGKRKTKNSKKQRYLCKNCEITFIENDGFKRMRHKKEDIVRAIHMHNDGFSLFKTQYHLYQHDGIKVTRRTISQWTKKYSNFLKSDKRKSSTKNKRKIASRRNIADKNNLLSSDACEILSEKIYWH